MIKAFNPYVNYFMIKEIQINTSIYEIVVEENKNFLDDDQYGLNDRSRYQKLSINQRVYLKNLLEALKV